MFPYNFFRKLSPSLLLRNFLKVALTSLLFLAHFFSYSQRIPPPFVPGSGGVVMPLACNTNVSICTPGVAGPFTFGATDPSSFYLGCLNSPVAGNHEYAFIMLNITQTGPLNLLINGNTTTGFIDVAVFNIPNGSAPCTAIQSASNLIACNYAINAGGCVQFGNTFGCNSPVATPVVTAGSTLMIVAQDWSNLNNTFTLELGPPPGAQTGPPDATILPRPPFCVNTTSAILMYAADNGGTWSGPGVSSNGAFNPAVAGVGVHTISYSIGVAPCLSSDTEQITVIAEPSSAFTVSNPCAGQTISFNGPAIAGATYFWSGPGAWTSNLEDPIIANASSAMNGTYSLYVVANGCTSVTTTQNVTVLPTPTVNTILNAAYCRNVTTPVISFSGAVGGTVYNWTNSNTGIGLGASGSGPIPSFTTTNAGATPITSTITVTPTAAGCTGAPITFTITVNPTPTVSAVSNFSYCHNASVAAIPITGNMGGGATYTWNNSNTAIGLGASGVGNIPAFTATNPGTTPISGTITVTPTANGCPGTPISFTITVNPRPNVVAVANQVICNGSPTSAVNFTGGVAGTTFNWTNNTPSIGLPASGAGNIGIFNAVNLGTAPVVATITVTPTANGCPGTPITFTYTVNPTPNIVAVTNQTLCANSTTTAVVFSGAVTGTTFNWTNSTPSIGLGASGSGNIGTFTALNAGTTPVVATITVTPTANGCPGPPATYTYTVNPRPSVNTVANQTLCAGALTTAVNFAGLIPGTTYNWTNSNPSIGLAGSGTGNIGAFTATNPSTTAAISSTITVTPTINGCPGTPTSFTITVNPVPAIPNFTTNSPVCQGQQINFFGPNVAGATHYWSGPLGWTSNGTNANIGNATPAMSGVYSLYVVLNGCTSAVATQNVNVVATPTTNAVAPQTVCNGSPTAAITWTGTGTTYNWTNSNTTIGLGGSGTGNISSFNGVNTGAAPVTSTITVTPNIGSCPGVPTNTSITVNPTPTVNAIANQVFCQGATVPVTNFSSPVAGVSYSWTNSNPTIGLAASGSTNNIPTFTAANGTNAPISATITITPTANGCPGTPISYTITVNPISTVNAIANQSLCNGASTTLITFGSPVAGTTYSWTNNTTSIGLAASGTSASIPAFTATNGTTAPVTATITVTPTANSCPGTPRTFTITVNPTPTVNTAANQTLCAGATTSAINYTGAVAGTVYNWTNSQTSIGLAATGIGNIAPFTATNAGTTAVTSTITVTPTANGCNGTPATSAITVNPTPTVNTVANQTLCNGAATTAVTITGNVAGTTYNWTNSAPSIGLAASGAGNIASFNAVNAGTAPVTATITITPTASLCPGTPTSFTITVNPTPTVNTAANQTLCAGATTSAINYTGAVAGTVYNWTNSQTSIGLAATGIGNIAPFTATNAGTTAVTSTITVTPTANGCNGTPATSAITVNPTPTVNTVANQTLCNGAATTAVTITGNVAGTTYNWTNSAPSIGLAASGAGNIASFNAVNAGTAPVTATITITPTASLCPGTPTSFTITVNPTPTVSTAANQTLCAGATTSAINYTGAVAGTVYNWTNSQTSIGLAATGSGNIAPFTATNAGTTAVTSTITVTPTANGCNGTPATSAITVNPTPTVNTVANQTLCNGAATTAVTITGNVAGTTYNWTNSAPSIGLAASGAGNIASFNAVNAGTAPVTATITITPTASLCPGTPTSFTITVNPTPTVNTAANQTLCAGATTSAINYTGAVAGTVYNWTNSQTSIGLAATGIGNIAPFTATNAGTTAVTSTITVTPTANGCNGTPATSAITVNPTPTVNTVANQTLCNGAATTAVTITGNVAGTTYNWTNSAPSIGLAASGAGNIASFNAVNAGTAPVTATITITPTASLCPGTPTSFTITVNPTPTVNTAANQTLCAGATTSAINYTGAVAGTVYNWTNSQTSIGLAATGIGNIAPFTATNAGTTAVTSTITVTPTANGCTGTPTSSTITVNPTPTVNTVANQTLCNGAATTAVTITGNVAGTTYNWTNSAPSIGLAASGAGNIASFNAVNAGTAPVTATITITPTASLCPGTPTSFTITVNPTPTVNTAANQTLCAGATTSAINYTGAVAGTVYNWTNSQTSIGLAATGIGNIAPFTATNAGTTAVTSTITVTPTANGCNGTPATSAITVNPTPTVNTVANQTLCNGAATTAVTITGNVAGTTYNWTNSAPSIGLAASGAGNIASFNAVNAGTAPVTATITITPTASLCPGTPTSFTITVNPTPTVNTAANQTLCAGATTSAINYTGAVAGTVYNWTNSQTSIGLAATGIGNIAPFTATNAGTTAVTSTITVTPTANGCNGTPATSAITVNPTPTVNTVANQTLCNGAATTAVTITGNVAGTTYNWTNSAPSIGLAASGAGNIASFNAVNAGTAPVTATITITPTASLCPGTPTSFTITVNPTPTVNTAANQTLCAGATTSAINYTGAVAGTVYNWTNSQTSIGLAATGSGNIAPFTATNAGTTAVTSTITVTPTANGCNGTPATSAITVNPTPTVNTVANQTLCNGAATTAVTITGNVAGTTYNWTNSAPSIGLAASGAGNIASFNAVNAGTAPVTATITITPTASLCPGTPTSFTITVNPTPTVNTAANQTLCAGATTSAINYTGAVAGTVYNWTNSQTSIGLAATGIGNIAPFTATNAGTTAVTSTITVTPTANGCTGTPTSSTITVNPTPTVNTVANQTLCNGSNTNSITFTGATAGTTYNWTNSNSTIGLGASGVGDIAAFAGVNTGITPVIATITVTPLANSCNGAPLTFTITVNPTPTVNNIPNQTLCNGVSSTDVIPTGPVAGSTFAWTNSNTNIGLAASGNASIPIFIATNSGNAPINGIINVTPTANGCIGTPINYTITVNPTPTVNPVVSQTVCNGTPIVPVIFGSSVIGTSFAWTNSQTSIGLAASGNGNIASFTAINSGTAPITSNIDVTPTANGCSGPVGNFSITVNPTPTINVIANQTYCTGASSTLVVPTSPVSGTTYTWVNSNTGIGLATSGTGNIPIFTATNVGNNPISGLVTITPTANSCVGTPLTYTITVNPTSTVDNVTNQTLCNGASTASVAFTNPVAGTTYAWTNSDATIGLSASGNGNIATFIATNSGTAPVTSTITVTPTANNCIGPDNTFTITVNPTPTVDNIASQTLCNGASTASVAFTNPVAGTTYAWTNSDATIGLSASGNGNIASFTATNSGTAPVTSTITITPIANNCIGPDNTFTITVNPTPTVDNIASQTLCNGSSSAAVNFTNPVAGTTYAWTNNDASIGLASSGIGDIASFNATNNGTALVTSTITITPTANNCIGPDNTFTITVSPTPTVDNVASQTLCNGASTASVAFTNPVAGTTYAWTNSDASIGLSASGSGNISTFNAINNGTAPVTSTITVTPTANNCIGPDNTFTITVNPTPTVDNVASQTLCNGASTASVAFTNTVAGTTYAWTNSDASIGLASNGSGNIAAFTGTNTGTAPVTSTITITPTANGCVGVDNTFTITVNPTPTVDNVASQTLCNGASTASVTFTNPVAGTTYAWTNSDATIGLASSGSGNIAAFTGTNTGTAPVTSTITITPTANGCVGVDNTFTITVNPTSTVDDVANQTLCNGASTATVAFTNPVAGTTYAWTNSDASIGLSASGSGNIATFIATNSGTAPVTSTITITPTANGCVGTPNTFTITVNPTPTVDNVASQTLCNGANTSAVNFTNPVAGTTYAWTNSDASIGLAVSGSGSIASFTGTNTGTAPVTSTITITPTANGCVGVDNTFTITVNPTPTVDNIANQILCNGASTAAVNFTNPVAGTTYAWTNSDASIGLAASGSGNIATFIATNSGTAPVTSTITITPTANGCVGIDNTFTINVNPTPTVDNIADQTLCNGASTAAVNFTNPVAGTTYAWTNSDATIGLSTSGNGDIATFTAINNGTAPVTSTITIIPTANNCVGPDNTFTITVNPTPTVDNVASQTLCNGASTASVAFTNPVAGTTYAWTNTDASIGLSASGSGNIAAFTATNSGTAPVTSTITITPTANNCNGPDNTFTITVNPTPTVDNIADQTLCNGATTAAVTFTNPVAGTTYAWTNSDASIGLSASGSGNIATFIATNNGTAPVTSTINIIPTANGCVGIDNTFTITVNPTPTVDNVADQTLCNGAATMAVNFTNPVIGTTYAWINSDATIGLALNGNGNIAAFSATNSGTAPVTSTITITPTANGCVGPDNTFTVTVNPTPTFDNIASQTLCNGAATTAVTFTNPVAGTTYAWTNNDASIGLASNGSGIIAAFTATNSGTAPVTSTITITPTANGCVGVDNTFTITVNPTPTVDNIASQTLCNGAATAAVTFTNPVAGTTYAWTNSDATIGLASSGSGNIGTFTATNTGTAPLISTITITPTANGCVGTPNTFTITVNPTPTVDNIAIQTLCNGAATAAVTFTNPVAGTTYAWTNSDATIGLGASGSGNIGTFTATNTGTAPLISTITITPTANGCVGPPNTFTITVNPTPTVDNIASQTLCNGAATAAVTFTNPVVGATYAWTNSDATIGLSASGSGNIATFIATNSGTAPVTSTITVTPTANNCIGPDNTFTITVSPTPTVDNVASQTLCNGASTASVVFTNPVAGTTYAWTNSDATIGLASSGSGNIGTFTATNTGTAPVISTITITPTANGCVGTTNTFTITVNPTPTVDNIADQTLCNGATTAAVTFTNPVAGTTYAWTNSDATIGLSASGSGNIAAFTATNSGTAPVTSTITVTPTANNCIGPDNTFTITVNPTPTVDNVASQTLCNGASTASVAFTNPIAGTTYAWTNSDATIGLASSGSGNIAAFTGTNTGTAPVTSTITITPTANGCVGVDNTFTITVNPTPTVDNIASQTLCNGAATAAVTFTNPVAGTTYAWTNSDATIGLASSGSGNIAAFTGTNTGTAPVTSTITITPTANGCVGTPNTFTITVNPTPTVDNIADQTLCNGATTAAVTFTNPVAGTTYAWTNSDASIGLSASGSGNIATFIATNNGTAPVTSTITIIPTANNCVGPDNTFTVTVNPTPTVDSVANQTLCNGASTASVAFTNPVAGTTYAWTNNDASIGLASSGIGDIASFNATNNGTALVTSTITITPTANNCIGPDNTFTITVNPTPTVDNVANQTLCNGASTASVAFTNPVAGTTYAWTNNDASIGLASSGIGDIASFNATNNGTALVTSTITITPTANNCIGPDNTFTITVNPTPTVDNVANQTLCNGSATAAVNFTNPVAGTTYSWTNSDPTIGLAINGSGDITTFTAINNGTIPVTSTITITPTANGCVGTPNTFTITVNPTPTVDNVASQTLCNGANTSAVNFTNPVAGTTYAWTNSDATIGLSTSGNGDIATFTAINNGTAPVTSTITITPTANGCVGVDNTFTITVNPTPTVDNVASQTLCNGASTASVAFTNPVAGTTYAWTNTDASIGLSASGSGNIAAFTATNSGTAPVTSTITITPTANNCNGPDNTFTITVNPTPTVDNIADQTLCNGATTAAVTFTNPVAGTTYAWTNSDASIGLSASGSGNIATFIATNNGTAPVTSTINIIPTANGCVGIDNTFTITVNPTPTVDNVADQTLCNGAATMAVNFTNPVIGTTYAWINSDATIGLALNGNGNIAAFSATNSGTAPVTSTITITPTANGCVGPDNTFTVTVNPTPTFDNIASQTLCNGAATTAVTFTNPVAGTTYAWTNNDASIGLASNGSGIIAAFTATNSGTAPVTSTITITPTANGCVGVDNTFTITVNPTPTVDNIASQTLCNGAATAAVTFTNPVAGTTYAWTNSDATIGLASSGSGNIGTFTATNTGTAPLISTITITPTANGCVGTPNTFTITVNPTPTVDNIAIQTLCNGAATAAVTFTNPVAGTTYAWTNSDATIGLGASGSGNIGTFTATNTGTAPLISTITITPTANGCVGPPNTFTITVNPTPTVDNIASQTLCNGAATAAVTFTNPVVGATYAWTNSDATIGLSASGSGNIATFIATNSGTAPVTSTITVTPTANNCIGPDNTFTITVSPTPTVDNVASQTLCNGASTASVVFTNPVAGTTYAWTNSDATIGLASSGSGNIGTFTATNTGTAPVISTITITPTANGCVGTTNTFTITVNPTPTVDNIADQTLCNGATTAAVTFTNPVAGTTYAWTNSDATIGLSASGSGNIAAFTATNSGTAPVTSTITVTPTANNCIGPDNTFTITVSPTPTVDNVASQTLCNGASTASVVFTNPVAGTTYAWTNSDATIGLASSGSGNIGTFTATNTGTAPVISTITITPTANGCVGTTNTFTITVNPTPTVDNIADQTLCNGAAIAAVNFTSPVSGTTYAWTNSDASIGLAANGVGNIATFNAINNGIAPVTSTITITPTANNCVGIDNTFTITVNPTSTVNNTANQVLCNGASTSAVTFTSPVAGTTYSWTNTNATIGLSASGNGDIASFTSINNGAAPVTSTITITPTANNCIGTTNTFTIIVNPTPTIDYVADQTLCNGTSTAAVNFTSTVVGTTFTWANSDATIGLVSTGNGNIASFTATNNSPAPLTSTITVQPTANNCTGPDSIFTITVNPTATVDNVPSQTLCNGAATNAISFTNAVAGTTYSWTNSDATIGLAATGSGNIVSFNAINNGTAPVNSTITITPTANNCVGTPNTFTITVNPTPTVDNINDQTLCNGQGTTAVTLASPVNGTTYAWSNSNTNIGLAATGTGDIASFTATNAGSTTISSTVTITPTANTCVGPTNTFDVTVNPTFIGTETGVICNGETYTFGGQPYTNAGTYPVTFATVNGCDSLVTLTLTVNPIYSQTINQTICRGTVYTFNGVDYNQTGTYNVPFQTVNGCDSLFVINLTVQGPIASFNANPPVGCVPLTVSFDNLSGPGVTSSSWSFGNGTTSTVDEPVVTYTNPGVYTVSLIVGDALGCQDTLTSVGLIVVNARPTAGMVVNPHEVWLDEPYVNISDASENATSWWYTISDGTNTSAPTFQHAFTDTGSFSIMQVVYNSLGCSDTAYESVHVKPVSTLFIPNAFSPNGDFENPIFLAYGNTISDFGMMIFDRWGEMIFKSESIDMGWDGTYAGKDCQQDLYVYKITYRDHRKQEQNVIGSVMLVR